MAKYRTIEQIRDALQCTDESGLNAEACYELGENIDAILRKREQAQPVSVPDGPPYKFRRYINGCEMAQGVVIDRQKNLDAAIHAAIQIAERGPNGEAPILVYIPPSAPTAPATAANSDDARDAERIHMLTFGLQDAIERLQDDGDPCRSLVKILRENGDSARSKENG